MTLKTLLMQLPILLWPRRCAFCEAVIGFSKCTVCQKQLKKLALSSGAIDLVAVGKTHKSIGEIFACYFYKSPVKDAIFRLKSGERRDVAEALAQCLTERILQENLALRYDVLVPVPSSKSSVKKRGYNQADLLAMAVSRSTGIPVSYTSLKKNRDTQNQMHLDRQRRLKNLHGAFSIVEKQDIHSKRVLLVDDVVTTGATLDECAGILLEHGALFCGGLCVATADHTHHT